MGAPPLQYTCDIYRERTDAFRFSGASYMQHGLVNKIVQHHLVDFDQASCTSAQTTPDPNPLGGSKTKNERPKSQPRPIRSCTSLFTRRCCLRATLTDEDFSAIGTKGTGPWLFLRASSIVVASLLAKPQETQGRVLYAVDYTR